MTRPAEGTGLAVMSTVITYITHVGGGPADPPPRAGDRVRLQQASGTAGTEAWLGGGRCLGLLPPAEGSMLASLGLQQPLTTHVTAVLPHPGRYPGDRVLLRVEAARAFSVRLGSRQTL